MKKMIAALSFFLICFAASVNAQNTIQADRIDVRIDNQMDRAALGQLSQQLETQGVYLKANPRFNAERKLQSITFNLYGQDKTLLTTLPMTDLRNAGNHVRLIMRKENDKFVVESMLVNP